MNAYPTSPFEHRDAVLGISFPLAAITIATFLIGTRTGLPYFGPLATALLAILSVIIIVLLGKTLGAIKRNAICLPE